MMGLSLQPFKAVFSLALAVFTVLAKRRNHTEYGERAAYDAAVESLPKNEPNSFRE